MVSIIGGQSSFHYVLNKFVPVDIDIATIFLKYLPVSVYTRDCCCVWVVREATGCSGPFVCIQLDVRDNIMFISMCVFVSVSMHACQRHSLCVCIFCYYGRIHCPSHRSGTCAVSWSLSNAEQTTPPSIVCAYMCRVVMWRGYRCFTRFLLIFAGLNAKFPVHSYVYVRARINMDAHACMQHSNILFHFRWTHLSRNSQGPPVCTLATHMLLSLTILFLQAFY